MNAFFFRSIKSNYGADAKLLANVLSNNTHLKILSLEGSGNLGVWDEGWKAVFDALQRPNCVLQELYLGMALGLNMGEEDVAYLSNSLANNDKLQLLDASGCRGRGWEALSNALHSPVSALEKVNLRFNGISDDILASFANALMHNSNSKLKELQLDDNSITVNGWKNLANALCNTSSIMDTFQSNHSLQMVHDPEYMMRFLPPEPGLEALLRMNRENSKFDAARRKIIEVHFSGNDVSMQPFTDISMKVLPHSIAWMARDEYGIPLLYQFLRNTSLFHDVLG